MWATKLYVLWMKTTIFHSSVNPCHVSWNISAPIHVSELKNDHLPFCHSPGALLFLCATAIKTSPLTFWKWLSVPNHVGHDNVGHFHRREWGVLGFFNKPLVMCFVMHWLYFTVKTHSVPSPACALLPKLPFLQLPFVMLSTPLRRYHLFILWNNNPVKTKQPHPLPTYKLIVGWMDEWTDRFTDGWMYDWGMESLLDWIIGMNKWNNGQINDKR